MPHSVARKRTARAMKSRLARAMARMLGSMAIIARAASWSARKLLLPPSQ